MHWEKGCPRQAEISEILSVYKGCLKVDAIKCKALVVLCGIKIISTLCHKYYRNLTVDEKADKGRKQNKSPNNKRETEKAISLIDKIFQAFFPFHRSNCYSVVYEKILFFKFYFF